MSFVLATTGQIGDLTFSSIKRTFEVKDYSQIFPGHGGVLDRFDSIIFNSMILGFLLTLLMKEAIYEKNYSTWCDWFYWNADN